MLFVSFLFACATETAAIAPPEHGARNDESHSREEAGEHAAPPAAAAADGWTPYGAAMTLPEAQLAGPLLADPAKFANQTVRVTGQVSSVCQKAGCWLVLADDQGHQMRVTMKEHAFGVPKNSTGQLADIEGLVVQKAVDPKLVEHYKSEGDGGAVPEEGKAVQAELVATSVRLRG